MIGQIVSHYRIVERLGAGGMGVVYKAEDMRLKRTVALKFLPVELTQDREARERLQLEAQAASALDHPNICTIFEVDDTADGRVFVAMSFYEGESLEERIGEGPLPVAEGIRFGIGIARGLAAAHEAGVIHRDIKPANLMLTKRGVFGVSLGGRIGSIALAIEKRFKTGVLWSGGFRTSLTQVAPEIDWLDRYLGPVKF